MYFAQRGMRRSPPLPISAYKSSTRNKNGDDNNNAKGTNNSNSNNDNIMRRKKSKSYFEKNSSNFSTRKQFGSDESINGLINDVDIGWRYSARFLNSSLNAACVSNELKSGNIQMETDSHAWCYFFLSVSPVPGIGLVLRRFTKPPHLQQRIEDTIAVSYLVIPAKKNINCKINIVEEMIHVCIELEKKGVPVDIFCCTKNVNEAKEWGDALLKGLAAGKSTPSSMAEKGMHDKKLKTQETIEKTMLASLEMGWESVIKTYEERQQQRIDEFVLVFLICSDEKLRTIGTNGGLENSSLRSLCWLSFLKFFPPHTPTSLWPSILKQSREVYEKETQDLWGMNNKSTSLKQVLSTIPPPSPSTYNHSGFNNNVEIRSVGILKMEAPGATAFQKVMNYDLMVDIEKDVTRTNNKIAFFRHPKIRESMIRILLVYALRHKDISYKQGMNDLVAAILLLLHRERTLIKSDDIYKVPCRKSKDLNGDDRIDNKNRSKDSQNTKITSSVEAKNVDIFLDDKYIEHDAYIMFSLIMERMKIVFCPNNSIKTNLLESNRWVNGNLSDIGEDILTRLMWIQNVRLKRVNEYLPIHFLKFGIQPHMYLLPWVRLIFSREYCMEGLWLVWDAIFSISPGDFSFSNYISVAMIEMCKDDIMSLNDMASILLFLQKPKLRSVAEALLVIDKAKILWDEDFPTNHE